MIKCGPNISCESDGGTCVYFENVKETCICNEDYQTFPDDNTTLCSYQKKSKVLSVLLETFVPLGAGHYYAENYVTGVFKSICMCLSCLFCFLVKYYTKHFDKNDNRTMFFSIVSCTWCLFLVVWYVVDVCFFALDIYTDGNNMQFKA